MPGASMNADLSAAVAANDLWQAYGLLLEEFGDIAAAATFIDRRLLAAEQSGDEKGREFWFRLRFNAALDTASAS
jgi:hypothetical protein